MKRTPLPSAIATATARANSRSRLEKRKSPRRTRLFIEESSTREWKSKSLRAHQRRTRDIDVLIASA
jgi:hypothetical protein